jgi:uncharacterized protein
MNALPSKITSIKKVKLRPRHTQIPTHHPWKQTRSNRGFDLIAPTPDMVDFKVDIAESLARIPRFNGHCESGPYSVAQHCVVGALAIWKQAETEGLPKSERDALAGYFLLHDAHEAYCGDIITPVVKALAIYAGIALASNPFVILCKKQNKSAEQVGSDILLEAIDRIKFNLDKAIYAAANFEFPVPTKIRANIKDMDQRMLATERRYLLGSSPQSWGADIDNYKPIRITGKMTVLTWPDAADAYIAALNRYIFKKNPI